MTNTSLEKTCGVWCILTYDGSVVDIVINYAMLVINLWITVLVNRREDLQWWLYLPLTAFLFAFQVILCLAVDCTGISVVWSALFGYYVVLVVYGVESLTLKEHMEILFVVFTTLVKSVFYLVREEFRPNFSPWECLTLKIWFGVFTTLVTWIYYLATEELITTVAHLCAALMGALIARRVLQLVQKQARLEFLKHCRIPND